MKRIQVDVRVGTLTRPAALAMVGCPKVDPDSVDPVQATAPSVVVWTKGVATTISRRSSMNHRKEGEEVGPGSNISVSDYIRHLDQTSRAPPGTEDCTTTGHPRCRGHTQQAGGSRAEDGRGKTQ